MKYKEQDSQYPSKRSVAETLLESISQSGFRPNLTRPVDSRRSRWGQIAGAFGMLSGLLAVGFLFFRASTDSLAPLPEPRAPVAMLEVVRGSVNMLPASSRSAPDNLLALVVGEPIHAGATIETGPESGRAAVRLAGGQSMRLDVDTRVRVASSTGITLERGAVYFDSATGNSLEVRTTLGVVRDIGTQFEVRLLPEASTKSDLRIRVREGAVIFAGEGDSHHATVGEELAIAGDGTLTRGSASIHGQAWDWVVDMAPAPELTNQPLQAFLDWAAREGGWEVQFADGETAALAAQTVLHGDIGGLTLKEALQIVFDGSGLGHRLQQGALVIGPRDEAGGL